MLDVSILWNPVFISELRLKKAIKSQVDNLPFSNGRCLDVGCGEKQYECLFQGFKYVGIDVEVSGRELSMKQPDIFFDGQNIPFDDDCFDVVFCTQVLEHVGNPGALLREMFRVLRPSGHLIISVPFVYPEHEVPYDFTRFSSFGSAKLVEDLGLEVLSLNKDTSEIETIAVMLNVYVTSNLALPITGFKRLIALFICFPISILASVLSLILPDDGALYLNIVLRARKRAS